MKVGRGGGRREEGGKGGRGVSKGREGGRKRSVKAGRSEGMKGVYLQSSGVNSPSMQNTE